MPPALGNTVIRAGGPALGSARWAELLCRRTWRVQPGEVGRAGWACCGIAPVTAVGLVFPTPLPRQLKGDSGLLATQPRAAWWNHPCLGACSSSAASWPCDLGWPWAAGSLAWSCCEGSRRVQLRSSQSSGGCVGGALCRRARSPLVVWKWQSWLALEYLLHARLSTLFHLILTTVLQGTFCRCRE